MKDDIEQAFKQRHCTVTWLDDHTPRGWTRNLDTFIETDKFILKTGHDIVDAVLKIVRSNHYTLMLHELPRECLRIQEGGHVSYTLYFDPQ